MSLSMLQEDILRAEGLLLQAQDEEARELLLRLAEDVEQYVDANCHTTDEEQWFAFPTMFERLCYRRVEGDPRELHDVGEPFDRLYADLALADMRLHETDHAIESLKRAVRWNPMDCGYRLDLAELFLFAGNVNECLALAYSVFDRASDVRHLVRAYTVFARWFRENNNDRVAAATLRAALRLDCDYRGLAEELGLARNTPRDPAGITDDECDDILEAEGLPAGANAEVAICLLMCASDAAADGERDLATMLTIRARDLVGEPAARALLALIREGDRELAEQQGDGGDHAG